MRWTRAFAFFPLLLNLSLRLIACWVKRGCVAPEASRRRAEYAVRQCGEAGDTHVDADRIAMQNGLVDFAFGRD